MCIAVFIWQHHPVYDLLLFLNRDEYHNRPTQALSWWEGGEILGGRDEVAGGTWLACSKNGKFAFVTNVRELQPLPAPNSRGDLPLRFLQSKKNPWDFSAELMTEADHYHGFNLIIADLCSKCMVYVTNRHGEGGISATEVSPGIHVLSNATLDSPWPKAKRLRDNFEEQLDSYDNGEAPVKEMAERLMMNTIKDDESQLPGIYPPEREYHLSSIFVEEDTPLGRYGTRSISAVAVRASGDVFFYERHLEEQTWEEKTVAFRVEK